MSTPVFMPSLGESVDEGTINRWLKQVGDSVKENEALLEINTDKVDTEIPSPASGTLLEIRVSEGTTIRKGTILAVIGSPEEAGAEVSEEVITQEQVPQEPAPVRAAPTDRQATRRDHALGFISPVVARLSSEYQVDLTQITGTGQSGRITKKDVLAYLEQTQGAAVSEADKRDETPAAQRGLTPTGGILADEIIPMTPVRQRIAEHMVLSKHTSPHVSTIMEADLTRVIAHRTANKESFARDGVNLTYTAYFVAAMVVALKTNPRVNSSWTEAGILIHRDINIGIATSLGEAGLIVPVIKNADQLSLLGFARVINDLAQRARDRKLNPDEVKGGTFTITNHGTSGSLFATPIINQPQSAILGVGAIQKRVVVVDDMIAIRPMVYLSLTFDHRILDGAIADACLSKVVESLQNWA